MHCVDLPNQGQDKRSFETNSQGKKQGYCDETSSKSSQVKKQNHINNGDSINKCLDCGKTFSTVGSLKRHSLVHEEKTYLCDDCGKSFARPDALKLHALKHHEDKPHICDDCGKSFTLLCTLRQHKLNHSEEKLNRNNSSIQSGSLKQHKSIHKGDEQHKCDKCGKKFTELEDLEIHKLTQRGDRLHKSEESEIESEDESLLKDNPDSESELFSLSEDKAEYSNKCSDCGRSFETLRGLSSHRSIHKEKSYTCDDCGKMFAQLDGLKRHNLIHSRNKRHKCDECNKSFSSASYLSRHRLHHIEKKPYKCGECGKLFTALQTLETHILFHTGHKPYKCNECDKSYTLAQQLKNHQLSTHRTEKRFKCSKCNYVTFFSWGLKVHSRCHKKKPFQCADCKKPFAGLDSLKNHRFTHCGEKPHKCNECGMTFSQSKSLQRHKMYHSGEKPCKCEECDKSFVEPGQLKRHQLTVHRKQKRFKCSQCGYATFYKATFKNHLIVHILEKSHSSNNFDEAAIETEADSVKQRLNHIGGKLCDECGQVFPHLEDLEVHKLILCSGNNLPESDEVKSEPKEEILLEDTPASDSELPYHSGTVAEEDEVDTRSNLSLCSSGWEQGGDDIKEEQLSQESQSNRIVIVSTSSLADNQNNSCDSEDSNFDWQLLHHPSPTNFPPVSIGDVQRLATALLVKVPSLSRRDKQEAEFVLSMAVNYPEMADRERNIIYQRLNLLYLAAYYGWPQAIAASRTSSHSAE